ncbi:tol-pal system protein YbgF [Beggiatoa alba B18LD]|uniref:Cell division coordinator CpoB n=1 Tax=Beggiatoa alba B18LD TaxID=395493 RepID=I3CGS9_9GAMM|nr:tol-pal system protein YbgF [Beggiatoa alba]EIJ42822.1 tol-pal system protein YbgF [Beggiatoa alba B18LD]
MLLRQFIAFLCLNTCAMSLVLAAPDDNTVVGNPLYERLFQVMQQVDQLRKTVLEQDAKLSQQETELQKLRGDNEVLTYQLEQLRKQQQDTYVDIDNRLKEIQKQQTALAQAPVTNPAYTTTDSATDTSTSPTTEPLVSSGDENTAYQQAFDFIQNGNYSQATKAFDSFLKQFPQSRNADNAQYWMAESYYALKNFNVALNAFNTLVERHPNSAKHPQALLKMGYIYYELHDKEAAKAFLEKVLDNYPGTATAKLAQERLQKIRREGL